jgi:hypothetical protein
MALLPTAACCYSAREVCMRARIVWLGLCLCVWLGCGDDAGGAGSTAGAGAQAGTMAGILGGGAGLGAGSDGSAGSAGTGAGADAAGSGGGVGAAAMSERQACILYVRASCNRRNVCTGLPKSERPCPETEARCPDYLFSEGSMRTVAGLLACADEFEAFPCEKIVPGKVPACVTTGTRGGGEPCVFGSQCQSLMCIGDPKDPMYPSCKSCTTLVPSGSDCSAPETSCPIGEICSGGTCTPIPDMAWMPLVDALPGLGEPCTSDGLCAQGVACVDADSTTTGEDGMCVAPPAVGAPCARAPDAPAALPFGHFCAEGAFCDQDDKCATLPAAGQLCGTPFGGSLGAGSPTLCAPGAVCIESNCQALGDIGATCSVAAPPCKEGLVCSPTALTCQQPALEGAPCTADTLCDMGTSCMSSVCTSTGLLGEYAASCGN